MERQQYLGLLDMLNGGGAGRAGDTFSGGPLSGLLNALGIRPMGFRDRLEEARPMARPAGLGATPRPAPPPAPPSPMPTAIYGPNAITTTALPPPGQMRDEDLVRLLMQALKSAPPATGYGPR